MKDPPRKHCSGGAAGKNKPEKKKARVQSINSIMKGQPQNVSNSGMKKKKKKGVLWNLGE